MGHYRMATTRNNAGIAHENGSMESARTLRSPLVPEGSTDGMHAALAAAGYDAIMVTEIEVDQSFRNFDEYWEFRPCPSRRPARASPDLTTLNETICARPCR